MPDPILPLSIITSFLSNLTIELLGEKISSWLAGLGDADRKNLNQAFKAICSDLAPTQQKQLKKFDEAKINIFKAAVYPIARYYSVDEKLDRIKTQLVTAIISQLPEPQVLVDDFVSATYSRMTIKSDPFIQAILDQLLEIAKQREPQIFVRIFKEGESLLVQVLLNGEEIYRQAQEGKSFSEFKHDHFMIQTTTRRLVSLIARGGDFQQVLQENQQEIIKFGEKLYCLLFPEPISDQLKGYWQGLSKDEIDQLSVHIFSNDSAITNLPFELSYTPDIGYFFQQERINLSRFVFEETEPLSAEMERLAPPPLKILAVVSAPDDLKEQEKMLDYEREQELIIEALNPLLEHHIAQVHFTVGGSLAEIQTSLQNGNYHILHYSGHGAFEGDMGYLVLETEEGLTDLVPADQLAKSLEQYHSLQLITLSGCQTAQFSDYENLNGVAQCLIQAGFPMVIGMQRSISDRAATSFAHHFYAQLAQQKGVNEALSATRQAMLREEQRFLKEGRNDIIPGEWTIPVLIRKNEQNHIVDFRKAPVSEAGEAPQRLLFSCARPLGRGFVGRRKEIRKFYQLYHAGNRAIALWGYGGVGKSSLATRLAEELNQRHDYHVFGFKGTVAPEIILSQLATLAGELMDQMTQQLILDANADEQQKLERLIDTLLTHHKLLVLFDNFEDNQYPDGTIFQPSLIIFLNRLIQRLPETTLVLFTTRYQMTELPVAEVNLGEFPFADTWKKMNRLAKLGSLATDNKRDIHYEIGGQPRSLELLDSILAETETSWETIKGKLAQVKKEAYDDLYLDILWGNLTPEAQNLLQWLSLFRAPMTEVELCKFSEFQLNPPDLASLQRMSLLFSVAVPDEGTWHYVHRLTAAFVQAEERLSQEEFRERHNRIGDYWEKYSKNSKSLDDWLEARYHFLQGGELKKANNIAVQVEKYLTRWGFLDKSIELCKEVLKNPADEYDITTAIHNLGIIYQSRGDYDRALELYDKSLEIDERLGDIRGVSRSYHNMAAIYQTQGDYDRSLELYGKSLEIAEKVDDISGVGRSYHQMGTVYQSRGDYDRALELYGKSLEIAEKVGDISQVSCYYCQMGIVHSERGDYDRALELYGKSLEIAEKLGDINGVSSSYHQMANVYYLSGNYDQALDLYGKSLEIKEKLGDISGVSSSYLQMGKVYHDRGDCDRALDLYGKSLEIAEKLGNISGVSSSYLYMGIVYRERGDYDRALDLYNKSLEIAEKLGDISGVSSSYLHMGIVHEERGDYDRALDLYSKSLEIAKKLGDISAVSSSYHQMANVYYLRGDYDRALDLYGKSLEIAEKLGDILQVSYSYGQMANVYYQRDDYDRALDLYSKSLEIAEKLGDISGVANSQGQIGKLLLDRGKYEDAVPQLLSAYQIFQKLDSPNVQLVDDWLKQIISKIGKRRFDKILSGLNGLPANESVD